MTETQVEPAALEYKAATSSAIMTGDEGLVEALVSITGVPDSVGDVIVPGAYRRTLATRRPKGIFSHKTDVWVARTEAIEELMPGDPRLPQVTKDGRPWPREAGALWVRCRFNLATPHGLAAYEDVKFFSASGECEWSIGYTIPKGGAKKKGGLRHIHDLDLWEYSQVLFGAAPLSTTLSVKAATPGEPGESEDPDADPGKNPQVDGPPEVEAKASPTAGEAGVGEEWADLDDGGAELGQALGTMIALMIPPAIAQQLAVDGGLPPEELHITLAYLGKGVDEATLDAARTAVAAVAASGVPLRGTLGGLGAFPAGEDGTPVFVPVDVPGLEVLRQRLVDALTAAGVFYAADHGYTPHVTLRYAAEGDALPEPVAPVPVEFGEVVVAVDDEVVGAFPLGAVDITEPDEPDDEEEGDDVDVEETKTGEKALPVDELHAGQADNPDAGNDGAAEDEDGDGELLEEEADDAGEDEQSPPSLDEGGTLPPGTTVVRNDGDAEPVTAIPAPGEPDPDPKPETEPEPEPEAEEKTGLDEVLLETKAGRVLSDANAKRLRTAYETIGEVLTAAGYLSDKPVEQVNDDEQVPPPPSIMPDSTAPSAMPNDLKEQPAAPEMEMTVISAEELKAGLDLLADAAGLR
ncbi:2'-5' RNA ligase family protein [Nonomuraea sp. NPDC003214]